MAEWTINGFKITMYQADHPPLHCHVRKDRNFIGKFNLETGTWLSGPKRHKAQAEAAIARWNEHVESNEPRFKHVGLSSDEAVVFCEMNNGKTYAMPLLALD